MLLYRQLIFSVAILKFLSNVSLISNPPLQPLILHRVYIVLSGSRGGLVYAGNHACRLYIIKEQLLKT